MGQVHPHSAYRGSSQPPKSLQRALIGEGGGEQWGNTGHKVNVVALGGLGALLMARSPLQWGQSCALRLCPHLPPPPSGMLGEEDGKVLLFIFF